MRSTLAPTIATMLGMESLTVTGDTSPTLKGWPAAVRPLTRRNAIAAITLAFHNATHADAVSIAQGLRAGDHGAALALALSLPVWAKPASLREGWAANRDGWRNVTLSIVQATLAQHDAGMLDAFDRAACADLASMEAARMERGGVEGCNAGTLASLTARKVHTCALPPQDATSAPVKAGKRKAGKVK